MKKMAMMAAALGATAYDPNPKAWDPGKETHGNRPARRKNRMARKARKRNRR